MHETLMVIEWSQRGCVNSSTGGMSHETCSTLTLTVRRCFTCAAGISLGSVANWSQLAPCIPEF